MIKDGNAIRLYRFFSQLSILPDEINDQDKNSANYHSGYAKISSLAKDYESKHESDSRTTVEVADIKDFESENEVGLSSRHGRNNLFNPSNLSQALKSYYGRNDFSNAMRLSNKLAQANYIPSAENLEWIVKILVTKDPAYCCPVLLNILKLVVDRNIDVRPSVIHAIKWQFRHSTDPFIMEASFHLFNRLRSAKRRYLMTLTNVNSAGDRIQILIRAERLEEAYTVYRQTIEAHGVSYDVLDKLPVHQLIQHLLMNVNEGAQVIEIFRELQSIQYKIRLDSWILLLQVCLSQCDGDGIRFAWENIDKTHVPSHLLLSLLQNSEEIDDNEMIERILIELSQRQLHGKSFQLTPSLAASLLDVQVRRDADIIQVLHSLEVISGIQANIPFKETPILLEYLGTVDIDKDELFDKVVDYAKDKESAFRTLLMNALLMGYNNYWSPTAAFYMYRKFMKCEDVHFEPNIDTFETLVSAAFRLGNAKKLSFVIYREFVDERRVQPNRYVFETIIQSSLIGKGYESLFYFLYEMRKYKVSLRKNIHGFISKRFALMNDDRYRDLFPDVDKGLRDYAYFVTDNDLEQSVARYSSTSITPYSFFRDYNNSSDFIEGWRPSLIKSREVNEEAID